MDLVADVGSTETGFGLFAGDQPVAHWRMPSDPDRPAADVAAALLRALEEHGVTPAAVERVTLASVKRAAAAVVRDGADRALGIEVVEIDARTPLPIRNDVDEPYGVGADRLVNAVAAHAIFARDAIVVDLGTATTYDCVTRDGRFIGGAIAPGVLAGTERLLERAAHLPRVELAPPSRVIGRRTAECLQSGIFYGAVDGVDGMVRRILAEWQPLDTVVVATGGFCTLVAPHCQTVNRIDPLLTLRGVRLARAHLDARGRAPGQGRAASSARPPA